MGVEDVDVLQAHALEALVEAGEQVFARSPFAIGPGPHVVAGLGGDDQFVAISAQVVLAGFGRSVSSAEPGGGP